MSTVNEISKKRTAATATPSADAHTEVLEFKPCVKNTLRAFFTLALPSGLVLKGCTYHVKGDSRWIGLPAREYLKAGAKAWQPIVDFTTDAARKRFQTTALAALDRHREQTAVGAGL